ATLLLNISEDAGAPAIVITPTMQVTETATPTATVTPSPTPTATPTAGAAASPRFTDWMLAMLLIGLCGMLVYFGSVYRGSVRWGVRLGLCTILGGLAAYSLLAILVPRDAGWLQTEGTGRVLLVTLVGIVVGLGGGLAWRVWLDRMAVRPSR
ncbi:MAG TPA: hypothetical protein VHO48_16150, partial [Anaerolineaceae bacterium]|nr:hypothetical protein [Anaerolineaceae bacterium]